MVLASGAESDGPRNIQKVTGSFRCGVEGEGSPNQGDIKPIRGGLSRLRGFMLTSQVCKAPVKTLMDNSPPKMVLGSAVFNS